MATAKRIIHLAKERALFCFPALAQHMVSSASQSLDRALLSPSASVNLQEQTSIAAAKQFLLHQARPLQQRLLTFYQQGLDRAMQTMYHDLRPGFAEHSSDSMALLDDETMRRQMDMERVTLQFREADAESMSLVNLMVAQLHEQNEVRERENPFRPYILARALYQTVEEMVLDPLIAKVLIQHLSSVMIDHLPQFYAEIRGAFEARGIRARLLSRPIKSSRAERAQRAEGDNIQSATVGTPHSPAMWGAPNQPQGADQTVDMQTMLTTANHALSAFQSTSNLGQSHSGSDGAGHAQEAAHARMLPSLHRLLGWAGQTVQANTPDAGDQIDSAGTGGGGLAQTFAQNPDALQDLIWNLFHRETVAPSPQQQVDGVETAAFAETVPSQSAASTALIDALNHYQALAAAGEVLHAGVAPEANQLFALRAQIQPQEATDQERMTIDVIAVLFEFILEDPQIPVDVRLQVGRLQIPFLKAAMLDRSLLQEESHPARKLLNRIGSATTGLDTQAENGQALLAEIKRIILRVLQDFETDPALFDSVLQELELFLESNFSHQDARLTEAVEDAEIVSVLLVNTTITLRDLLIPLKVDVRAFDFILLVWARVLVRAFWLESVNDRAAKADGDLSLQFRDTVAELVWSAQPKVDAAEHHALLEILPGLVQRLKTGLHMIQLPEVERQYALDQLVAMHTDRLRATHERPTEKSMNLTQLRQHFARLELTRERAQILPEQEWAVESAVIEEMFSTHGVEAEVELVGSSTPLFENDQQILDLLRLGACIERLSQHKTERARLTWISAHKSLYVFTQETNSAPIVYSPASFVAALREGNARFVEYAPVFERAVDALLLSAEALEAKDGAAVI